MTKTPDYSAHRETVDGVEVARLADAARNIEVAIAPKIGNMAYEIRVGGKNVLWFPFESPAELRAKPILCGIPFLAPWANRLDQDAWWGNGKRYLLNAGLGNLRRDANGLPIHGLLNFSPAWDLVELYADATSARAVSRLEFWKYPDLMAQFPLAHEYLMSYRLADGEVEVQTTIRNLSGEALPVAVGYHPYFQIHDAPRDAWKAHVPARCHVLLGGNLIPTGAREPVRLADPHPLTEGPLDDVFTNLEYGPDGRAVFWVEGERERISVVYGPKYKVAVAYAPPGREFICFEPMAAVTNAFNLAHAGLYRELQSIPPGGTWDESFWIRSGS